MKQEITLEQAKAVVNAHREAEFARKGEEARKLIGHCFKYRNRYSAGDEWWLYAMPTAVSEDGRLTGLTFQHTASDSVEIMRGDSLVLLPGGGWTEISASEFWEAAAEIRKEVRHRLSREPRTKKRRRPRLPRGGKNA